MGEFSLSGLETSLYQVLPIADHNAFPSCLLGDETHPSPECQKGLIMGSL